MKCPRCSGKLSTVLTRASVIIDECTLCRGVWLDQGELNFFVKKRKILADYDRLGLQDAAPAPKACPRCEVPLKSGKIPGFPYEVEECSSCRGLFFDAMEFERISSDASFKRFGRDRIQISGPASEPSGAGPGLKALPSLGLTTTVIMGSMYAVLFGLMVFFTEMGVFTPMIGAAITVAFVVLQFLLSPIIMDWSLRLVGSLDWVKLEALPPEFQAMMKRLCEANEIPIPKVGIIRDGSPQAYTYGRTPRSARVVLSQGLLDVLTFEEVEAVVAHELGHVRNWDFVVMTLAQLVPLLLYQLYRVGMNMGRGRGRSSGGKSSGGAQSAVMAAAVVAYIAYLISDYLVRFVSRVREYHADHFSALATGKPNALMTALVKIGFGLATDRDESPDRERGHQAVQSMGIMNVEGAKEMALALEESENVTFSPGSIKEIMRWDLWSPWAAYYELYSTHPLTAKRLQRLGDYAIQQGQKPYVRFDLEKPESYWDDFFVDLFVMALPLLGLIGGAIYLAWSLSSGDGMMGANLVLAAGVVAILGWIKTSEVYPGGKFLRASVGALLKKVKVSPVRSFPVTLEGRIIGRGDSGNIFSEDLVLRDETGLIFLDHEPFGPNWFFSLGSMDKYRGQEVKVEGWYRRSPVPYLEVKRIQSSSGSSSAYTYYYRMGAWLLLPLVAALWVFLASDSGMSFVEALMGRGGQY
jgi:Zn-dependent protease with chaperone function/Zn-finger nucleic acid-binding protein